MIWRAIDYSWTVTGQTSLGSALGALSFTIALGAIRFLEHICRTRHILQNYHGSARYTLHVTFRYM